LTPSAKVAQAILNGLQKWLRTFTLLTIEEQMESSRSSAYSALFCKSEREAMEPT
jgi:hypothetical protein